MAPILAATRTLETLVEDLRTLALAESGTLRLAREPVDVAELVHQTIQGFGAVARAANVAVVAEVAAGTPPVDADPIRLGRALGNLIDNALRHAPPGSAVRVAGRPAGAGSVRLAVHDDGPGIPADLLPRIFERFVKGEGSPGSGLGLAIVRDVVEAHGGRVSARSAPGEGSDIVLVLPAAGRSSP